MNRREFLKNIGRGLLGVAVVPLVPKVGTIVPKEGTKPQPEKIVEEELIHPDVVYEAPWPKGVPEPTAVIVPSIWTDDSTATSSGNYHIYPWNYITTDATTGGSGRYWVVH
jgi:hypothetical protein